MKFTLEIELGNDAMQTGDDMSSVFSRLADYFVDSSGNFDVGEKMLITDANGNRVGKWQVSE